jgi:hypothetical protein
VAVWGGGGCMEQPGHEVDYSFHPVLSKNEKSATSTPAYAFIVCPDLILPLLRFQVLVT